MAKNDKQWLLAHRLAAGFSSQEAFALALNKYMNKAITAREVGGWERCEKKYRDNVPFEEIATVLNEHLSAGEQVTAEQLRQDHERDVRHCQHSEQCEEAQVDETRIRAVIEGCSPTFKSALLQAWLAQGCVESAARNIAERIRAGKATDVLMPFSRPLEEVYAEGRASPDDLKQIWAVVEAVSRACVIPGTQFEPGTNHKVNTDQAWLVRIRLLVAQNLPLAGFSTDKDRHFIDDATRGLITRGVSVECDPLQRFWEVVSLLVERYDPGRAAPPNPQMDKTAFERYCGRLNASLSFDNVTKSLFFHLMTRPESDEVIDLFYQYLPGLMSFISHKVDGPTDGLFIDDEDMLGGWIARWLYRTGGVFSEEASNQERSASKPTQENRDMETPASNAQTINVKTGGGSTVILATAQDKSTASIHQRGVEVDQILPLLDKLLTATKQESIAPTALRREVRDLQTEIEENNAVPPDLVTRLTNAIPATLTLSDNTTTILNNIRQLWQHAFGGGV